MSLGGGALGEGRHARVRTVGGRPRDRFCDTLRPCKEGGTSSSLQPNSEPTFTPGPASGPISTQPARVQNVECRGFQTPGSNLSAPAPEWFPGWRKKLPQTSQAPLRRRSQPAARAGGWRRKAEMDWERMLSLLAIRPGNVSTTPAYSTGHPSASPAPGCTGRLSLSPCASFGLFYSPFSSKRGHTDDLKEFVQPGSVGQVC